MTTVAVPAALLWLVPFAAALIALLLLLVTRRQRPELRLPSELVAKIAEIDTLARSLNDLSRTLLLPQSRGALGETMLAAVLSNWLPRRSFELQHAFRDGGRVDAVVRLADRLVPIDSKFPLEALREDLLAQPKAGLGPAANSRISPEARRTISRTIADIAARYIRPAEGTYDFALMYVASEAVFYHAFVAAEGSDELARAALAARVIPVSPSSLFLYLQTVAHGLRGFLLSSDQKRLAALLEGLQRDLTALARAHATLGGHLRNAARAYEESLAPLGGLDRAVSRIMRPED
jgi:DNA recombination protein RmuC